MFIQYLVGFKQLIVKFYIYISRFERKILRKIYRPTELIDGTWRIQTDEELDNLIEHKNIINFIKAQRLRWLGHVEKMPKEGDVKKMYKRKLIASGTM
jgi:hypothetical protein